MYTKQKYYHAFHMMENVFSYFKRSS